MNTTKQFNHFAKPTKQRYKANFANRLQVQNINNSNSIVQCTRTTEEEEQHITKGFAIVGFAVVTINICNATQHLFGLDSTQFNFSS